MRLLITALMVAFAAPAAWAQTPTAVETYKATPGNDLEARIFRPEGAARPAPAILLFHGGGWAVGDADWTDPAAKRFADKGMVAISIEYRLSGETATPRDAFNDACDAFRWVRANARRLGVDAKRIAGYGVSAGGQLVSAAGAFGCPEPKGGKAWRPALMLLRSPSLDVAQDPYYRRLMRGRSADKLSPVLGAGAKTPPAFIVQGEADTLTPMRETRAFCGKVTAAGGVCEIQAHPGVGHLLTRNLADQEDNYDPDPEAVKKAWEGTMAFLVRYGWIR